MNTKNVCYILTGLITAASSSSLLANDVTSIQTNSTGMVVTEQYNSAADSSIIINQENTDHLATIHAIQDDAQDSRIQVSQSNNFGQEGTIELFQDGVTKSNLTLEQNGSGNTISALQTDTKDGIRSTTANATIQATITGNSNLVDMAQIKSTTSSMDITVEGNNNSSELLQDKYSSYSTLELQQYGDENVAVMAQTKASNDMTLIQDGNDNYADMQQTNSGNTMSAQQSGNDNDAILLQNGRMNAMHTMQTGNGGHLTLTQN